jgi:tetratricopeptide (TPR) repeat protein
MAIINEMGRWDYIRAEKEYGKANEMSHNRLDFNWNYYLFAEFLIKMNRPEDALGYLNGVQEHIPGRTPELLIKINILSGNKRKAYEVIKDAYFTSGGKYMESLLGDNYIWVEEYDSAKVHLESAMQSKDPLILLSRFQADLALAYFKTKNYQQARAIIMQLKNNSLKTNGGSPDYYAGWYYSGIGEVDSAFIWLEKAFRNGSPELPWLKVNPQFENLKKDPRYWDLYKRTGHKTYDDYVLERKK